MRDTGVVERSGSLPAAAGGTLMIAGVKLLPAPLFFKKSLLSAVSLPVSGFQGITV